MCQFAYILQLGKKPRFWHEKHLLNPVHYVLALLDPLDEVTLRHEKLISYSSWI